MNKKRDTATDSDGADGETRTVPLLFRTSTWMIGLVALVGFGINQVTCAEAGRGMCPFDAGQGLLDAEREVGGALASGALVGLALVGIQESIDRRREATASARTERTERQNRLLVRAQLNAAGSDLVGALLADVHRIVRHYPLGLDGDVTIGGEPASPGLAREVAGAARDIGLTTDRRRVAELQPDIEFLASIMPNDIDVAYAQEQLRQMSASKTMDAFEALGARLADGLGRIVPAHEHRTQPTDGRPTTSEQPEH